MPGGVLVLTRVLNLLRVLSASSAQLELHETLRDDSGSQYHQQQVKKELCFWQVSDYLICKVICCFKLVTLHASCDFFSVLVSLRTWYPTCLSRSEWVS